jgi:hypothetical protein
MNKEELLKEIEGYNEQKRWCASQQAYIKALDKSLDKKIKAVQELMESIKG